MSVKAKDGIIPKSSDLKSGESRDRAATTGAGRRLSTSFNSDPTAGMSKEEKKKEEKEKEKLKELDKKLLGPGGRQALNTLTEKELDRKFKQLLATMGVKESSSMKDKYTTEQKKALIEAVLAQQEQATETAEGFVEQLQKPTGVPIPVLEKLAEKLEDSEWASQFIALDGCLCLMEAILFSLFKSSSAFGAEAEDVNRLEKLLGCIIMMVNSGLGLEQVLEIPNSLKHIAQSLEHVSLEKKTAIFEFFCAACLMLEDSTLIVEALDFFRSFNQDSTDLIKEWLRESLDFKVGYFMLINTLIVNTSEVSDRRKIRSTYLPAEIYDMFKEDELEDDIKEQLGIYDEELENDKASGSAEELQPLVNQLLEGVKGSSVENEVKEMFGQLNTVSSKRAGAWEAMASLSSKVAIAKDGNKLEVLASVIKQEVDSDKSGELVKLLPAGGGENGGERRHHHKKDKKEKKTKDAGEENGDDGEIAASKKEKKKKKSGDPGEEPAASASPPPPPGKGPPPPPSKGAPPPPPPGKGPPPPPGGKAPPPPPGGPPPPPGGPPPPPGKGAPPLPPGGPGKGPALPVADNRYTGPPRPQMVAWRFTALPAQKAANTVFNELKPDAVKLIDFGALEDAFIVEEKKKEGGEDGAGSGVAGAAKSDKKKTELPKVMSQQRATVIEIIMGRLKKNPQDIKSWIATCDKKYLTPEIVSELKSLFPVKPEAFEEEKAALQGFPNPSELTKNEFVLYELLTVPRIREKLGVLSFDLDVAQRLTEAKSELRVVSMAIKELKNDKLKKILEIALAAGNYLNSGGRNGKAPAAGFKLDSLLKMNEVVSPKHKVSLLQFIIQQLYDKHPELANFYEEMPSLEPATAAIGSLGTEIGAIKKGAADLKGEMTKCQSAAATNPGEAKWAEVLTKSDVGLSAELNILDEKMKEINDIMNYFGETGDAAQFFAQWLKFVQTFQKTVKTIETKKAREEATKKKDEEKKRKAEEKALLENFVTGIKTNGSLRGLKPEQKAMMAGLSKAAQTKEEEGLITQISTSLKSGQTFSRLRGHRAVNDLKVESGDKPKGGTIRGKGTVKGKKTMTRTGAAAAAGGAAGASGGGKAPLSGKTIRECSMIVDDILSLVVAPSGPAPGAPAPTTGDKKKEKVSIMAISWGEDKK